VAAQGLYFEQTTLMSAGNGKSMELHSNGYLKEMKLKNFEVEEGTAVIVRADKEMLYQLDTKAKTYSEMTFTEMRQQMQAAGEQMKKMQEELKDLPPEQRKMMEGMMAKMMKEKDFDIKRTGEKKKVSGYSCEKVLLLEGGEPAGEFWVTKDLGSMKDYAKDWTKLMEGMMQGPMMKAAKKIAEIDGFVMQMKMGDVGATTTKLEKRNIADSEFEIPAGYKKVDMNKMHMGEEESDE
jgi:hypothetical protein